MKCNQNSIFHFYPSNDNLCLHKVESKENEDDVLHPASKNQIFKSVKIYIQIFTDVVIE